MLRSSPTRRMFREHVTTGIIFLVLYLIVSIALFLFTRTREEAPFSTEMLTEEEKAMAYSSLSGEAESKLSAEQERRILESLSTKE